MEANKEYIYIYNNRNDGGPAAGLLSLVEVPEKAIVPFMVNAFDYVTFIHRVNYVCFRVKLCDLTKYLLNISSKTHIINENLQE
jgi:hypothetical protein